MLITLENKIAIVTGAAHGIGRAIAEVLCRSRRATGDRGHRWRGWTELATSLPNARFVPADVSAPGDVQKVVAAAAALTGRIDVLCNNAAYLGPGHASADAADEEWERCFRVALLGSQRFIAAVLPYMIRTAGRVDHQHVFGAGASGRPRFGRVHQHQARYSRD